VTNSVHPRAKTSVLFRRFLHQASYFCLVMLFTANFLFSSNGFSCLFRLSTVRRTPYLFSLHNFPCWWSFLLERLFLLYPSGDVGFPSRLESCLDPSLMKELGNLLSGVPQFTTDVVSVLMANQSHWNGGLGASSHSSPSLFSECFPVSSVRLKTFTRLSRYLCIFSLLFFSAGEEDFGFPAPIYSGGFYTGLRSAAPSKRSPVSFEGFSCKSPSENSSFLNFPIFLYLFPPRPF